MCLRVTIRDLLWLMLAVALAIGWWLVHRRLQPKMLWVAPPGQFDMGAAEIPSTHDQATAHHQDMHTQTFAAQNPSFSSGIAAISDVCYTCLFALWSGSSVGRATD
jgi:hypothetical protein